MIYRTFKKGIVLLAGLVVIGFGIALIFLPGPAILVIPLGLMILAAEFDWAKRIVLSIKKHLPLAQRSRFEKGEKFTASSL